MKKNIYIILSFFTVALCQGKEWSNGEFITVSSNGTLHIGSQFFELQHWGKDWKHSRQSNTKTMDVNKKAANELQLQGFWNVHGGKFLLHETVNSIDHNSINYKIKLKSDKPCMTMALSLCTTMFLKDALNHQIVANGKNINFEKEFNFKKWQKKLTDVRKLQLELPQGTAIITGEFDLILQDNRKFAKNTWELRILCNSSDKAISNASLELNIKLIPHHSTIVPLNQYVNMGFADNCADDHKGGWTDQGPDNDLRMLPVGELNCAGIPFEIINPATNKGRSCLVLRGKQRRWLPASAEIDIQKPTEAKYLYVLNAIAWPPEKSTEIGEITCEYIEDHNVAEVKKVFPVIRGKNVGNFWMPPPLSHAALGWEGRNASARVGLYVSCYELSGKPVKKIRFESKGNAVWMIVGVTFSDRILIKKTPDRPVIIKADQEWLPTKNLRPVIPGSILDFSNLLDAPAGKHGFTHAINGHLEFEKRPGVSARFYGANIAFSTNFMDKKNIDRMADEFASTGYNIVRLHHFDRDLAERRDGSSTNLNSERIDCMDYLISAFKRRGIYITLDLFIIRHFEKGEISAFPNRKLSCNEVKALLFINKDVRENVESFGENLLNHINPYTKLAWKDDPAIVSISLVNEDTIFSVAPRIPWIKKIYEKCFDKYVNEKKLTITSQNRTKYWKIFLSDTYRKAYALMSKKFQDLGVRTLLTDQNYWNNIATTLLREDYDIADNHFYWGHPTFLENRWKLPAIVEPGSSISCYAGGLNQMFPIRIFGKPFSITEWNYVNPNKHNVEGAFLVGAYSALQDWSLLCRFAYSHSAAKVNNDQTPIQFFDTAGDPLRLLSERAGVVAFLRGDVATSKAAYPCIIPRDYLKNYENDTYPTLIKRMGLIGRTGTLLISDNKDLTLPKGCRALIALNEYKLKNSPVPIICSNDTEAAFRKMQKDGIISAREWNWEQNRFESTTGELVLHRNDGTFRQITRKSEAFVLGAEQKLSGNFAAVKNKLSFAGILIASWDNKALTESKRILILHLTDTKNTGIKFKNSNLAILESWGKTPLLIRRGEVDLTLTGNMAGFNLYGVDWTGKRICRIPLSHSKNKWRAKLTTQNGNNVIAAYELVKEP